MDLAVKVARFVEIVDVDVDVGEGDAEMAWGLGEVEGMQYLTPVHLRPAPHLLGMVLRTQETYL